MSSLYNIAVDHLKLIRELENTIAETDFETQELEEAAKDELKALEINEEEAREKIKSYYYFIKQKEGENVVIGDEIKRLKAIQQKNDNLCERLKKTVDQALRLFGERTKSGGYRLDLGDLKVWNVFHKPLILTEGWENSDYGTYILKDLSSEYVDTIKEAVNDPTLDFEFKPANKAIKDDLKAGVEIKGAKLDADASYIRFK